MTNRLNQHIEHEVDEARMERLWQGVSSRSGKFARRSSHRGVMLVAGGFAVAAATALAWVNLTSPGSDDLVAPLTSVAEASPLRAGGASLRTAGEEMAVNLDDGSRLTLSPRSRIAMEDTGSDDVTLALEEGRVECNVSKDEKRLFSVLAGPVVVRVVGTRFSVERSNLDERGLVRVDVQEGVVEVSGPDGVRKHLSAGETWSVKVPGSTDDASAANEPSESLGKQAMRPRQTPQRSASERAKSLFEEARAKRNSGDAAGAAALYERFLSEHASDGRAGVAALELGRLRMDQLGDVEGAISPLKTAASRGAGGLGDDALARLAQAYSRLGDSAACRSARERYMKSHPAGVHVNQVRKLCP